VVSSAQFACAKDGHDAEYRIYTRWANADPILSVCGPNYKKFCDTIGNLL